jgi:glycosyltransferase involved in cell wall biosynthesis
MDVSLVIPAYNEAENVPKLVEACAQALAPVEGSHEILIIDDGSTDDTGTLLTGLAANEPRLRIIRHEPGKNIGCHPSELEGFKSARGDVALFLPADLQIHPSSLPAFLDGAQRGDVVASRRVQRADNRWRRFLARANNRLERLIMGLRVNDAHSAMLVNRRTLDEVVPHVRSRSALIPAELMFRARRQGLRITEIDVPHYPRTAGRQTGATISEIVKVQLDMLRLRRRLSLEASSRGGRDSE